MKSGDSQAQLRVVRSSFAAVERAAASIVALDTSVLVAGAAAAAAGAAAAAAARVAADKQGAGEDVPKAQTDDGRWCEVKADDGTVYYWNTDTDETS